MLRRLFNSCLLRPEEFPRSRDDLQVLGVFNPGAVATSDGVVLLVRVAEASRERRRDYYSLPRFDAATNTVVTEWIRCEDALTRDQRLILRKDNGRARLTFVSHLRVVHSRDGRTIDSISESRLAPANDYEEFGVEDPRITPIGDTFWITYVAVSRHGVATALASTRDFQTFERHGIIFPPENKDVVLFPEKIADQYWALHRPNPRQWFAKPEIWTATSPDLVQWREHQFFLGGTQDWEIGRVGGGTPPMRRSEGWVSLYHGNSRREGDPTIGVYSGGALLLDTQNPRRILGQSGPILVPTTEFERTGFVPDVAFPTGWVDQGQTVLVYYGAADTVTAVVEFSWHDIIQSLRPSIPQS
jgi:predicted GH43/DUF377 family glycosyl hydrolase